MNVMLPQRDGKRPHITGRYGEQRSKGPHGGIDFNYNVPGQRGINKKHPVVNSPVSGKVTSIGKGYNTVNIRTPDGYNHQILHLNSVKVRPNNKVEAGKPIGTMGGKGPKGPTQYSQHVHYQIKDQKNRLVNPSEYHKNQFKTRQR
jgi:putative chitinase